MGGNTIAKFHELRDKRLGVALDKIKLLGNLGRPSYGATEAEKRQIVEELQNATQSLAQCYRLPPAAEPPTPSPVPSGTATGGASFESEVRWALDAVKRGDTRLAADRLRRCLGHA